MQKLYWFKINFFFNIIFRVGFELYLQLYFASLYNLKNSSFEDIAEQFSFVVSIIWQVLVISFLIITIVILFRFKSKYTAEGIKESKVRIFLEEFQDNKKYLMIDHIIFMIRRILLSILIIFAWGNGLIQVCIFIIICALVLVSKLVFRPFKSLILNIQSFIFEIILLVILWFFASFNDTIINIVNKIDCAWYLNLILNYDNYTSNLMLKIWNFDQVT